MDEHVRDVIQARINYLDRGIKWDENEIDTIEARLIELHARNSRNKAERVSLAKFLGVVF